MLLELKSNILFLFYFFSAFGTVDHNILIDRIREDFFTSDSAMKKGPKESANLLFPSNLLFRLPHRPDDVPVVGYTDHVTKQDSVRISYQMRSRLPGNILSFTHTNFSSTEWNNLP